MSATRTIKVVGQIIREVQMLSGFGYGVAFKSMSEEDRQYLGEVLLGIRRSQLGYISPSLTLAR